MLARSAVQRVECFERANVACIPVVMKWTISVILSSFIALASGVVRHLFHMQLKE